MTVRLISDEGTRREDAADWLVRVQSDGVTENDLADFDAWLCADPLNAAAYDTVLAVTLEIQAAAPAINAALRSAAPARSKPARTGWLVAGGLAAAATIALAVVPMDAFRPAGTQGYQTAIGEHRTVKLADGSTVDMNAGTRLSVTLARDARRLEMPEGEAVFDVAADKSRPFLISVGDRTVRVVGTRFDVRRRDGKLSVTVDRGVVEVQPSEGVVARTFRLHPGQRLDHMQGAAGTSIAAADPAAVFSWRTGRLIYRDQPLSDVIADLNQQFPRPIRLEDKALADAPVSGVLVLDDEAAVIRRLALLAPLSALPSDREIVLRSHQATKP